MDKYKKVLFKSCSKEILKIRKCLENAGPSNKRRFACAFHFEHYQTLLTGLVYKEWIPPGQETDVIVTQLGQQRTLRFLLTTQLHTSHSIQSSTVKHPHTHLHLAVRRPRGKNKDINIFLT